MKLMGVRVSERDSTSAGWALPCLFMGSFSSFGSHLTLNSRLWLHTPVTVSADGLNRLRVVGRSQTDQWLHGDASPACEPAEWAEEIGSKIQRSWWRRQLRCRAWGARQGVENVLAPYYSLKSPWSWRIYRISGTWLPRPREWDRLWATTFPTLKTSRTGYYVQLILHPKQQTQVLRR